MVEIIYSNVQKDVEIANLQSNKENFPIFLL